MAVYDKDKNFSFGWVLGGTVLMFLFSFLGGLIAGAAGVANLYVILAIVYACFLAAGFVVGWQSEGQTIIEAGLAAILAIVASAAIKGFSLFLVFDPMLFALTVGPPFVLALLGAWIGEKVQGDEIVTKDD